MLLFINGGGAGAVDGYIHFNTSHVIVYLWTEKTAISEQTYFNTSHVIVYQGLTFVINFLILISIHLMLLFIESAFGVYGDNNAFQYISCYCLSANDPTYTEPSAEFQYISCYCLSQKLCKAYCNKAISIHLMLLFICVSYYTCNIINMISIHLMLLFITYCCLPPYLSTTISIHLMLLFIEVSESIRAANSNFNTSHVIVYL